MITEKEYVRRLMVAQKELQAVYAELAQMPAAEMRGGLPQWPGWRRGLDTKDQEWALERLDGTYSLISEALLRGPSSVTPTRPAPIVTVRDR